MYGLKYSAFNSQNGEESINTEIETVYKEQFQNYS